MDHMIFKPGIPFRRRKQDLAETEEQASCGKCKFQGIPHLLPRTCEKDHVLHYSAGRLERGRRPDRHRRRRNGQ